MLGFHGMISDKARLEAYSRMPPDLLYYIFIEVTGIAKETTSDIIGVP